MYPLISVIVPIYKVEAYLPQCVESLVNQTYKELEIILVDDGSPDNCPSLCDEYAVKFENIRVLHKDNGGLVSARKAGLELADGEYATYVDGDDWVEKDHFQKVADAIVNYQAEIVIHGYTVAAEVDKVSQPQALPIGLYSRERIERDILPTCISTHPFYSASVVPSIWSKVFKKSLLELIQYSVPNEITIGEDTAVSYPALFAAETIAVIDDCGYMYRVNNMSMTRTYDRRFLQSLPILLAFLRSWAKNSKYQGVIQPQLEDYTAYMTVKAIANEMKSGNGISDILSKLKPIINDGSISSAIHGKRVSLKYKAVYFAFYYKNILLIKLLQMRWRRR